MYWSGPATLWVQKNGHTETLCRDKSCTATPRPTATTPTKILAFMSIWITFIPHGAFHLLEDWEQHYKLSFYYFLDFLICAQEHSMSHLANVVADFHSDLSRTPCNVFSDIFKEHSWRIFAAIFPEQLVM